MQVWDETQCAFAQLCFLDKFKYICSKFRFNAMCDYFKGTKKKKNSSRS